MTWTAISRTGEFIKITWTDGTWSVRQVPEGEDALEFAAKIIATRGLTLRQSEGR